MSQYIVATILKMKTPLLQDRVEEMIQRRSRIESYGNLVFTSMILNCWERHGDIAAEFVSQSAITACMRSVCVRNQKELPEIVDYKPCPEAQACMREAQMSVIQMMTSFDSDQGLGQIINSAARRYLTVFTTNFSEHMVTWVNRNAELSSQIYMISNTPLWPTRNF